MSIGVGDPVIPRGIKSLVDKSGRTVSDMDRRIADLASSQGMAPAEQRMMLLQKTAADMGRTVSDKDAQLFGMGEISFEEAMSRARPSMDRVSGERNLMQQEQMFFLCVACKMKIHACLSWFSICHTLATR